MPKPVSTGDARVAAGLNLRRLLRLGQASLLNEPYQLDTRLMLAKVSTHHAAGTRHTPVATRYPDAVAAAEAITMDAALDQLL